MTLQETLQDAAAGAVDEALGTAGSWAENARQFAIEYTPKLIGAVLVFVIGRIVVRLLSNLAKRMLGRSKIDPVVGDFLGSLIYGVGLTIVVIATLERLGVPTTSAVAVLGAAGLAVGFALQGSLSNFAAGIMILVFRPFGKGDYIEGAGTAGTVESIAIFATTLKTPDNKKIIVPNNALTGGNIVNYSAHPVRRIDLVVGISYDDDMGAAKRVFEEVLGADPAVLADPAPTIAVSELGDSSVNFVVRPWVATTDFWPTRFRLIETIKARLDAAGITIPYPQRDVHLHGDAPGGGAAAA